MLNRLWMRCGVAAEALRTSRHVIPCPARESISAGYKSSLLFTRKPLRFHLTFHSQNLQLSPVTADFSPLSPGTIISNRESK